MYMTSPDRMHVVAVSLGGSQLVAFIQGADWCSRGRSYIIDRTCTTRRGFTHEHFTVKSIAVVLSTFYRKNYGLRLEIPYIDLQLKTIFSTYPVNFSKKHGSSAANVLP